MFRLVRTGKIGQINILQIVLATEHIENNM